MLLVLTILAMILGELVPKSLALQDPTRTALVDGAADAMVAARCSPGRSRCPERQRRAAAASCCGVASTGHRHVHSPEEIELLIAESRDGGLLEPLEQVRLHRALRLGLRTARQLMVPRARLAAHRAATPFRRSPAARRHQPVQPAAGLSRLARPHRRHAAHRDVVLDYISGRPARSIRPLLRPILRVRETMPADRLLAFLRERRSHHGARRGRQRTESSGLITLEDVVAELLGGVSDEFKVAAAAGDAPAGRPGAAARCDAPGSGGAGARRVAAAATRPSAAHIAAALGRLPEPGERVTIDGVEVEIEVVEDGADRVGDRRRRRIRRRRQTA